MKNAFLLFGFLCLMGCASSKHSGLTVVNRSEQEKDDLYRKEKNEKISN